MIHIGNKLRHIIDSKGLNKERLALDLEMTKGNLYKIFEKEFIRTDVLLAFCSYLNIHPIIFFLDFEGVALPSPETIYGSSTPVLDQKLKELNIEPAQPVQKPRLKGYTTEDPADYNNYKQLYNQCRELVKSKNQLIELQQKQIQILEKL